MYRAVQFLQIPFVAFAAPLNMRSTALFRSSMLASRLHRTLPQNHNSSSHPSGQSSHLRRRDFQQAHCKWLSSSPASDFCGMKIGDEFQLQRTFSQEEVDLFAKVSLDANPLHSEGAVSSASVFSQPVVHGMLVASMFSAVIGNNFPGSVYLSQKLKFSNPTLVGDTIVAEVKVLKLRNIRGLEVASMSTVCKKKESGETVVEGEAMCQLPRRG